MRFAVLVLYLPLAACAAGAKENHFADTGKMVLTGSASYYGAESGRRTASGEIFKPEELTAAHRTLPFGTKITVTHLATGQSCTVRINDRGPFVHGRILDLSKGAARICGLIKPGHALVQFKIEGEH